MALPKPVSIYQQLMAAAPTIVSIKLTTGDIFTNAQVISIATNGIQVLDEVVFGGINLFMQTIFNYGSKKARR